MSEEISTKKLTVDSEVCIACGACYGSVAPDLFVSDDEGKSKVIKQPENEDELKKAQEAVDSCPAQAISLE